MGVDANNNAIQDLNNDVSKIKCCEQSYQKFVLKEYFKKLNIDGFVNNRDIYYLLTYLAVNDLLTNSEECLSVSDFSILKRVENILKGNSCLLPLESRCKK